MRPITRYSILLLLLAILIPATGYADIDELMKKAQRGDATAQYYLGQRYRNGEGVEQDDKQAMHWYSKAAEQGLVEAQAYLGAVYYIGEGVEQDYKQAVYWFRKAAEQGNAVGQNNLGVMYDKGEGVGQSDRLAVYWYRMAAKQGDPRAQFALGLMYKNGKGVGQSDRLAVYWYRKAAKQGDPRAQYNLGSMYRNGEGAEEDDEKAVYWYRKAAEQGLASAQYNLGLMYYEGDGVELDVKQAVSWTRKAAEQGYASAQANLDAMHDKLDAMHDKRVAFWSRQILGQGYASAQAKLDAMHDKRAAFWSRQILGQGHSFGDDIPQLLKRHKQAKVDKRKWLFVIGAGEYKETSDILYSRRSAELFAKVASKILGIDPSRSMVLLDKDATSGSIKGQLKGMLRKVKSGDTLYFYYSGHGVPDPADQNAPYMLATDHVPDFIHENDYFRLENIYQSLSTSGAKVVAFMDSCFSGRTDDESVFGSDKGAVRLKPKELSISAGGSLAVITAGSGKQFSNAFPSRGHRLFSYYLMKAMLKGHTKVSTLYDNVSSEVYKESLNLGGLKEQKPVFLGNRNLTL